MVLAITCGEGLRRPRGKRFNVTGVTVPSYAAAVQALSRGVETWWSPHCWRNDYRLSEGWESSSGIAIDIDYTVKDAAPPGAAAAALTRLAESGQLPGSIFHLTPHGARVIFTFASSCRSADEYRAAARGAGAIISRAIADTGYKVDVPILEDLGRLFFAPNAFAKGVQRKAEVIVMHSEPFTPEALAEHAPEPEAPTGVSPAVPEALAAWNRDHPLDLPRHSSRCPVCDDSASFGHLPDDPQRWHCFSTDHAGVGIRSKTGYHGDALDLEAHRRGCRPIDVLRKDGYLGGTAAPAAGATVTPIDAVRRPLRNRSYLTAVTILETGDRILKGQRLELNEMTGRAELGRRVLDDEDVSALRSEIERTHAGGLDKQNNEVGLTLSKSDIHDAVSQVAKANRYHPVREYLQSLQWDGVSRIDSACEDLLGADRSPLNIAITRCWFISAVARAVKPGCKVDTMLVLIGKQGALKSTFFRVLSDPWFNDTVIDIHKVPDAYQMLRTAWIYEWSELSMLRRAKDAEAVKSFLSSAIDTYMPKYARIAKEIPRSCVIVGTSNQEEFLTDDSGNRRFWPLRCGVIDIDAVFSQRDQLWAEAMRLYDAGEPWWFDDAESGMLANRHEEHTVTDSWTDLVEPWIIRNGGPGFTTADVLEGALKKPAGQWSRGDEMRVARILKAAGWKNRPAGSDRKRTWWKL